MSSHYSNREAGGLGCLAALTVVVVAVFGACAWVCQQTVGWLVGILLGR